MECPLALTIHRYFISCPRGLAPLLHAELEALGGRGVISEPGGCRVRGPLAFGYRMCLWSRLASRVILLLEDAVANDADELHAFIYGLAWEEHMHPEGSLTVEFLGTGAGIDHSRYGAQKVKDAIVDRFRDRSGARPSVERNRPDLRVHLHVRGRGITVGIDLSGESLHRRGYRLAQGPAPLKENLAAALLIHGGWPGLVASGGALLDPMAGSGTLVIEAALMALDLAPGLRRSGFGFERWLGHDAEVWSELQAEALERAEAGLTRQLPPLVGLDRDAEVIDIARRNAARARVDAHCRFDVAAVAVARRPDAPTGLVVTNPPYGERLGDKRDARATLADLGRSLQRDFSGWTAAVIAPDDGLVHALCLAVDESLEVSNGPTAARLIRAAIRGAGVEDHPLHNRLRKNLKRLRKWATKHDVTCYRVYDADLPEYNAAIDVYEGHAHVQEYEAPSTIEPEVALHRLTELTRAVSEVCSVPADRVSVKTRRRQRGLSQYERMADEQSFFVAREGGHRFWVNLTDYLDTGLFLDHRDTRALVGGLARGARFLNLFCYTASVSVYAAVGGAQTTTSVDLSNTYLAWAERNFALNDLRLGAAHRLVRADCLRFLAEERGQYDVIFLDPPTFSNSKAMTATFDVRRDHRELITLALARLAPGGTLLFSTNARRFKLDPTLVERCVVEDWTRRTTPADFVGQTPHQCWRIAHGPGQSQGP